MLKKDRFAVVGVFILPYVMMGLYELLAPLEIKTSYQYEWVGYTIVLAPSVILFLYLIYSIANKGMKFFTQKDTE